MPVHRLLKVCVDRWLPQDEPANQPEDVGARAAAEVPKLWEAGRTLRVRFMGGDPLVQARVVKYANEWCKYANIKFDFGTHLNAEIRIAFQKGGSWSHIGRDALGILPIFPTMNLGWLSINTSDNEVSRVVLHEFGHALGMIHEHQNPSTQVQWNKEAVYKYYAGPPNNWTPKQVDRNLFQLYSAEATKTQFTQFDKDSIMLYPIPQEHTLDGFQTKWNRVLSETDKSFIAQCYPFL